MTTAKQAPFTVVRRGYDSAQVDAQIEMLSTQLRTATAARGSALTQVQALSRQLEAGIGDIESARAESTQHRAEANTLRGQVAELSTIPHTVDGMSERLQQMVRIAQDEVNDMRRRATTSAAHILTLAQAEADELRERSDAERHVFEAERRTSQEALHSQLEESRTRLERLRGESDAHRARLDAELDDRRATTDKQFAAEIEERRSAMLAELAAHEAARREDAGRIIESAAQQARAQLADAATETQRLRAEARHEVAVAQRELEELRALQHQVSEQLTSVRALLDWTLPQMPAAARSGPGNHAAQNNVEPRQPDRDQGEAVLPGRRDAATEPSPTPLRARPDSPAPTARPDQTLQPPVGNPTPKRR